MKKWLRGLFILLLAPLCILFTELIACRIADPILFDSMTAPVRASTVAFFDKAEALATNTITYTTQSLRTIFRTKLTNADAQSATEPPLHSTLSIADPVITELRHSDGIDTLTGGTVEVVYYCQSAPEWCDELYGSDRIGSSGCGPASLAMVVASLTEHEATPATMAQWSYENGYWAKGRGSYLSLFNGAAPRFGMTCESFTERDIPSLQAALSSGGLLVALMGPGHFTEGGHFIVLRGVTLEGTVLVADPNSLERSLTPWDPALILDELSRSTSAGAPLWLLRTATE